MSKNRTTLIMNIFPKKGLPSSGKGEWVDLTWEKVLNSSVFFLEGIPNKLIDIR